MDEIKKKFDKFCNVMEQNTKGVAIGCYSVAFIGLAIALRKVRPFSKFKKPNDIPNLFIRERRELTGVVERIEPNGALLMVNHKPLVKLLGSNNECLPVKVSGVNISGHGISWLQAIVANNEVKFIPISKRRDSVECEVILPQIKQQNKLNKLQMVNVGESLVSIGFATIEPIEKPLLTNKENLMYYSKLKAAEQQLERKQLGVKYYIKPTKLIIQSIYNMMSKIISKSKLTTKKKVPKLAIT